MADTFRIEIPVEVTNKTDMGEIQQLERALEKIQSTMKQNASTASTSFEAINSGAEKAGDSMDRAADAAEDVGDAASQAGKESGTAFNNAGTSADKFSQRIEKSNQSLRKMFAQKLQLTLAAIDKVSPILKSVTTSLKNLTSKAWHVALRMKDFVTAPFRKLKSMIMSPVMMTLGITGIGMGAGSFVSTFSDFTAGMSNVKALSGATNEEFIKLTETAEHLGATTKFTATEASQGMQYLAMAGWETNDIIAAMPGLLDLAAAGSTDLGTAADIVSDVMTAMGMSAEEASRAADIFARTATGTNTTIVSLGEALKYAAPVAHSFGLELSEVSTITGMMANAGIKGSMAGTALRTSLLQMASPTKEASKAMTALGLSFADDSGKMKDMKTIIRELGTAFGGLTDQEKLAYADDIFGARASSAWLAVIEQGAEEYDRLFENIDKSNGAAQEMANTQLDNLTGDVTLLNSALDGMKISVMNELNPALREGVQWITAQIPKLTEMLTGIATKAIDKLKEVKENITNVFNSSDFQNAEGFADKFFIAWDKLIAEPFTNWWNGGGQQTIIGAVSKLGENLGQMYHGIITGIFAAIKGEEIDFDGLNITGLARAGAEAAKSFIMAFKDSLDIGGLMNDMPGLLKGGLFGFGAIKVGSGMLGVTKTIAQLKTAFTGLTAAAAPAASATSSVATSAATAAAGAGKLSTVLGVVKTMLAGIPGWGWMAAGAIAAVTAGIIAYNVAQAKHEQELLNTGAAAKAYGEQYTATANKVQEAMDNMDEIKKIQIIIEENKGGNKQVIAEVQSEIDALIDRTVYLTAALADDTLTAEQIAEYQEELDALKGSKVTVEATLIKNGYDVATVALIMGQYNAVEEGAKELSLILHDKTELTPEEIQDYITKLRQLMRQKTEKELYIHGTGLKPEQVTKLKEDFDNIKAKKAELEIKINKGQGNMTDKQWASLVSEYQSLTSEAGQIEIVLQGATEANAATIKQAKDDLASIQGEASGIVLSIAYAEGSELKQTDLNNISSILSGMADHEFIAKIGLQNTGMDDKEMQALIDKQNQLYRSMVESSGGVFTQRDIEQGRISQEDYDWWIKDQSAKAEIERMKFNKQVEEDRKNIPELVEKRDAAQEKADSYLAEYNELKDQRKDYEELHNAREMILLSDEYRDERGGLNEAGRNAVMALGEKVGSLMPDQNLARNIGGAVEAGEFLNVYDALFGNGSDQVWNKLKVGSEADRDKALENYEKATAEYNSYDEPLQRQYDNEVAMLTQNATAGLGYESGLTTSTLDEMAAKFGSLDEAGRKAFADAVEGVRQFNEECDYIDKEQMVNVGQVLDTAIGSEQTESMTAAIADITAKLTEMKGIYDAVGEQGFTDEQATAFKQLSESLNLEGIEGLQNIGSAIEQINALDPAALDLSDEGIKSVTSALTALGGDATTTEENLKKVKAAATALAGTYEVKVKYITEGSLPSAPGNAYGGIYDGAFLSWVAEDGPEAIIPLGADKRGRGLDLWLQAGEMLGINSFAEGGIMAPFSGMIAGLPDEQSDGSHSLFVSGSGSGGNTIQINVTANPEYSIEGESTGDIMESIREHQYELAEILGAAVADQLEDILSNVP